jgi:hypothetical protein
MPDSAAPTLVIAADIRRLEMSMNRALASTEKAMAGMTARATKAEKEIAAIFGRSNIGAAAQKAFGGLKANAFEEASRSVGVLGGALQMLGPAGLAAAAGIAAIAVASEKAINAAEWAESLDRASKTLGVSTTALQEWDFAMSAMGIGAEKGRASLEGFEKVVGRVEDGLVRGKNGPQVKLFDRILGADSAGDVQQKLRQLGDITAVLGKVQDYARNLSATQRAGVAAVLKIDPEVLTTIVDAKDKVGDLVRTAHDFGVIADRDVIAKAAEAAEKLHTVSTVIDDEVKVAFAGLATPLANAALGFLHVAQRIGDVVDGARASLDPLQDMLDKLKQVPGAGGIIAGLGQNGVGEGLLKYAAGALGGPLGGMLPGPIVTAVRAFAAEGALRRAAADQMRTGADIIADADRPKPGGDGGGGGGGRRGGRADHSGTELAEASIRYLEAVVRATADLDKAHAARLQLIDAQYDLAAAHAKEEKNPQVRGLLLGAADKTKTADLAEEGRRYAEAQTEQAQKFVNEITKLNDAEIAAHTRAGEAADKAADAQLRGLDAEGERLKALEELATTTKARKALAEKILANEQAKAAIELGRQARHDGFDPAGPQAALDATGAAKRAGLDREYAGPIARFADESTQDPGAKLEDSAVTAMRELNAGIVEAIGNSRSLHDVLKKALNKSAGDLLGKGLAGAEGLAINGLGSPFGQQPAQSPGASAFKAATGVAGGLFKLFGFAHGTGPGGAPGGPAIVGEHGPEIANLPRGTSISPNSSLRQLLGASLRAAPARLLVNVNSTYDMRGNSGDEAIDAKIAASEQRSQSSTFDAVKRALPGLTAQYQSEQG